MSLENKIAIGLAVFIVAIIIYLFIWGMLLLTAISKDQTKEMKRRGMKPLKVWPWDTGEWK